MHLCQVLEGGDVGRQVVRGGCNKEAVEVGIVGGGFAVVVEEGGGVGGGFVGGGVDCPRVEDRCAELAVGFCQDWWVARDRLWEVGVGL